MSQSRILLGHGILADMSDMARLQRNLKTYLAQKHRRTTEQLLLHKGNQLRLELFKGFWAHRFQKSRKKGAKNWKGIMRGILAASGGIKVRLARLISPWDSRVPAVDKHGKKLSLWQQLVAQEVMRRVSGSGVLGVSFLGKRWRFTKTQGRFLVTNRTNRMGEAARFEMRDDAYIITGFTPGLEKLARRYGILRAAVQEMSRDIEDYLGKLYGPAFVQQLHAP